MKKSLNKSTSTRLPVREMTAEDLVIVPGAAGVYAEHDVATCPDVRAAGHNPHGLTVAQVGAGWRLLAEEEIIGERHLYGDDRHGLERWAGVSWDATGWSGNSVESTYRTKRPPGFFLPKEATPPPAGTKYVHTFVCNACPRTCTMETETAAPGPLVPGSFDMQCPFRRPEFIALWKAGPAHTLTP